MLCTTESFISARSIFGLCIWEMWLSVDRCVITAVYLNWCFWQLIKMRQTLVFHCTTWSDFYILSDNQRDKKTNSMCSDSIDMAHHLNASLFITQPIMCLTFINVVIFHTLNRMNWQMSQWNVDSIDSRANMFKPFQMVRVAVLLSI